MRQKNAALLAREAADWQHRGLIEPPLAATLAGRYDHTSQFVATVIKWLGLIGVLLVGMAIMAGIGLATDSLAADAVMLGIVAVAVWYGGVHLTRHGPPVMGMALVTIGLIAAFGAMALGSQADTHLGQALCLLVTAILSAATAYAFRLRWPLLLALLAGVSALGATSEYGGYGEYFADIADPRLTAAVSLAVVLIGLGHLRAEEGVLIRYAGFGVIYSIMGLLYLDMSLWFLSLPWGDDKLPWTLIFTGVTAAEVVIGALIRDHRLLGFGIVFLGIDFYTQFFELYWDRLSAGWFFLAAGGIAVVVGGLAEAWARKVPAEVGEEAAP